MVLTLYTSLHMASLEELRNVRIEKRKKLEALGINVHPHAFSPSVTIKNLIDNYRDERKETLTGRITAFRTSGAITFGTIDDGTASFQIVFKKDSLSLDTFNTFNELVDLGDFIAVSGESFTTQRGTASLLVESWTMLGKTLLPLPDKWGGIQDQEELYRKRYLDLLSNSETKDRFLLRSKVISAIRKYFNERDFVEIETPILQMQAGGAMARTFNTHHNDLDIPMVLRIALEIDHKVVMAGGIPRIYEIGKNFRNEGSDPTHIQEFTMIEWYDAFMDFQENIAMTKELLYSLARDVVGKTSFKVWDKDGNEQTVDFESPWPIVRFDDLLRENAQLDISTANIEEIHHCARNFGMDEHEIATTGKANILDYIYKKSSRNNILNPTFVTNYPGDLKPLAQQNSDGTAMVAQLIIAGAEITNQYAELVDPLRQRELLEQQSFSKAQGDQGAMDIDERFVQAMEHGMAPMTGFGMGVDRLLALFTEQKNLRDVILFPIMREKKNLLKINLF